MEFCFLRAGRPIAATAAFALLLTSPVTSRLTYAQAPAGQPAQGGTPAKNWKDRPEYDLYAKAIQDKDAQSRLQTLNTWQDKYPTTDYSAERAQLFLATYNQLAQTDPTARQKVLDAATQVMKNDPKSFDAMYFTVLWGPAVGGTSPSSDIQSQVDTAAHGVIDNVDTRFDPKNKPASVSDADWQKAKNQVLALAHNDLAWEATSKKDNATAENEYKASLTADPEKAGIAYSYGRLLMEDKKYQDGLFEVARAAVYDGPGAIPAAKRPDIQNYFDKAYQSFHGGKDGEDQVLALAKTNAVPPPDFKITDAGKLAENQAKDLQARIDSDPKFKLWYTIKQNLTTGEQSDSFFNNSVKGAEIPGKAVPGMSSFTGTVISVEPADKPTKITLGVEDPLKADAVLDFAEPISPATPIKVGDKLDFAGEGESFTKDPYTLTFSKPVLPSAKTGGAPKKAPTRHTTGKHH